MRKVITYIKPIALLLVITFLLQDIVWANPDIAQKNAFHQSTLSVPNRFTQIAGREPFIQNLIGFSFKYILESTDISKFNLRLMPDVDGVQLVLDFDGKHREGENWVVPCSATDENGRAWKYEAVVAPDNRSFILRKPGEKTKPAITPIEANKTPLPATEVTQEQPEPKADENYETPVSDTEAVFTRRLQEQIRKYFSNVAASFVPLAAALQGALASAAENAGSSALSSLTITLLAVLGICTVAAAVIIWKIFHVKKPESEPADDGTEQVLRLAQRALDEYGIPSAKLLSKCVKNDPQALEQLPNLSPENVSDQKILYRAILTELKAAFPEAGMSTRNVEDVALTVFKKICDNERGMKRSLYPRWFPTFIKTSKLGLPQFMERHFPYKGKVKGPSHRGIRPSDRGRGPSGRGSMGRADNRLLAIIAAVTALIAGSIAISKAVRQASPGPSYPQLESPKEPVKPAAKDIKASDLKTVKRAVDGDTIELEDGTKVRLIGIDTPESRMSAKLHKDAGKSGRDTKAIIAMGKKAAAFTRALVEGKKVRMEFDVDKQDRYGRTLAYVYLEDGTFVNAEIIRQGYAHVMTIPPNVKHADEFRKLYREARENNRGLWAPEPTPDQNPGTPPAGPVGVIMGRIRKREEPGDRSKGRSKKKISGGDGEGSDSDKPLRKKELADMLAAGDPNAVLNSILEQGDDRMIMAVLEYTLDDRIAAELASKLEERMAGLRTRTTGMLLDELVKAKEWLLAWEAVKRYKLDNVRHPVFDKIRRIYAAMPRGVKKSDAVAAPSDVSEKIRKKAIELRGIRHQVIELTSDLEICEENPASFDIKKDAYSQRGTITLLISILKYPKKDELSKEVLREIDLIRTALSRGTPILKKVVDVQKFKEGMVDKGDSIIATAIKNMIKGMEEAEKLCGKFVPGESPDMAAASALHVERNARLAQLIWDTSVYRVADGRVSVQLYEKHEFISFGERLGYMAHRLAQGITGLFVAFRIWWTVARRLKDIRKDGGILEMAAYSHKLDVAGLVDDNFTREGIRETLCRNARIGTQLFIVKDRFCLFDDGPIAHTRRGVSSSGHTALWLGSKLFTNPVITDEDIALLILEETKHILFPDAPHSKIRHSDELKERLLACARGEGEKPSEKLCEADMAAAEGPGAGQVSDSAAKRDKDTKIYEVARGDTITIGKGESAIYLTIDIFEQRISRNTGKPCWCCGFKIDAPGSMHIRRDELNVHSYRVREGRGMVPLTRWTDVAKYSGFQVGSTSVRVLPDSQPGKIRIEVKDSGTPQSAPSPASLKISEVQVHMDHYHVFYQVTDAVDSGIIPAKLPLILFDYHSDNFSENLLDLVSSANWVKYLAKSGIAGDIFWAYPPEDHSLLDKDHNDFKDIGEDWKALISANLPLLKKGVLLSFDMDYFARTFGPGHEEFRPKAGDIRRQVMEIFRFLKENGVPVYLVNGAYSSPFHAPANYNKEFRDSLFEAAETFRSRKTPPAGSPAECLKTIFLDSSLRTKTDISIRDLVEKRKKADGITTFSPSIVRAEVKMGKDLGIFIEGARLHTFQLRPELLNLPPPADGSLHPTIERLCNIELNGAKWLRRGFIPSEIIKKLKVQINKILPPTRNSTIIYGTDIKEFNEAKRVLEDTGSSPEAKVAAIESLRFWNNSLKALRVLAAALEKYKADEKITTEIISAIQDLKRHGILWEKITKKGRVKQESIIGTIWHAAKAVKRVKNIREFFTIIVDYPVNHITLRFHFPDHRPFRNVQKLIERLRILFKRHKEIDADIDARVKPDYTQGDIKINLGINIVNLTYFWRALGISGLKVNPEGYYRSLTQEEVVEKLEQRAKSLLDGIKDPAECRAFVEYIWGNGTEKNPGLINIVKNPGKDAYRKDKFIKVETLDADMKCSYEDLLNLAKYNPYFAHYIPEDGIQRWLYFARAAGSVFTTAYIKELLKGRVDQDFMIFVSQNTLGFAIALGIRKEMERLLNDPPLKDMPAVMDFSSLRLGMMKFLREKYYQEAQIRMAGKDVWVKFWKAQVALDKKGGLHETIPVYDKKGEGAKQIGRIKRFRASERHKPFITGAAFGDFDKKGRMTERTPVKRDEIERITGTADSSKRRGNNAFAEGDIVFPYGINAVYRQLTSSTVFKDLKRRDVNGNVIVPRMCVIDERGMGSWDFITVFALEELSRKDINELGDDKLREECKRLLKRDLWHLRSCDPRKLTKEEVSDWENLENTIKRLRETGDSVDAEMFIGEARTVDPSSPKIPGYPSLRAEDYMRDFGMSEEEAKLAITSTTEKAEVVPHSYMVNRPKDLTSPIYHTSIPIMLESREVHEGAYLKAILINNGIVEYYKDAYKRWGLRPLAAIIKDGSVSPAVRMAALDAIEAFPYEETLDALSSIAKDPQLFDKAQEKASAVFAKIMSEAVIFKTGGKIRRVKDYKYLFRREQLVRKQSTDSVFPEVKKIAEDILARIKAARKNFWVIGIPFNGYNKLPVLERKKYKFRKIGKHVVYVAPLMAEGEERKRELDRLKDTLGASGAALYFQDVEKAKINRDYLTGIIAATTLDETEKSKSKIEQGVLWDATPSVSLLCYTYELLRAKLKNTWQSPGMLSSINKENMPYGPISPQMIKQALDKLVDFGLVEKKGEGDAALYKAFGLTDHEWRDVAEPVLKKVNDKSTAAEMENVKHELWLRGIRNLADRDTGTVVNPPAAKPETVAVEGKTSIESEWLYVVAKKRAKTAVEKPLFVRKLTDDNEMIQNVKEAIVTRSLTKKVVLAFDGGLAGLQASRVMAVFKKLKELKENPDFSKFLPNFEIVIAPAEKLPIDLEKYLDKQDVEIFMFARATERAMLSTIEAKTHAAYIDEARFQLFLCDVYYPLMEIVTIALSQSIDPHTIEEVSRMAVELGMERPLMDESGALIFTLLPNAAPIRITDPIKQYALLKELLINA